MEKIGGSLKSTTHDQVALIMASDVSPNSASSHNYYGFYGGAQTGSANLSGSALFGAQFQPLNYGSGTVNQMTGVYANPVNSGGGTVNTVYDLKAGMDNTSSTTTTNYGLYVAAPSGNTITNLYSIVTEAGTGGVGFNTITPVGALDVRALNGTTSVASISGKTSFATLVVDNSGVGDLFTASSSGLNRFVITQNGNVGYWDNIPRYSH